MYSGKLTSIGLQASEGGGDVPLYDEDEIDVLRDELMDAFALEREEMITRDEITERKRTELALKEQRLTMLKKARESEMVSELKAKQDALKKLYENVLTENVETGKGGKGKKYRRRRRRKDSDQSSEVGSFHAMYTVYRDPVTDHVLEVENQKDGEEMVDPNAGPVHVMSPQKQLLEQIRLRKESIEAKERSKFVLKQDRPKPPSIISSQGTEQDHRQSLEMAKRGDVRFSKDHYRYSFDVDVAGPFYTKIDKKKKKPRMRHVATQVMLMDDIDQDMNIGEMGSQTEFWDDDEAWSASSGGSKRRSRSSSHGSRKSGGEAELQDGGGDASSSSHASETTDTDGKQKGSGRRKSKSTKGKRTSTGGKSDKSSKSAAKSGRGSKGSKSAKTGTSGKTLERKESKRREAETMARPRGYRDLNLKEQPPYVTFEAETLVTAYDLDKEIAKNRGFLMPKDNILWPTCDEFDIDMAVKKVEDYIKRCWTLDTKWMFVVQPLEVYHDNFRRKYVFEAKFSLPSPTTPVPPATASVFFVFEISLYAAKEDPVKVTYVVEGTRYPHKPGRIPFQEKWLLGIVSDKIKIQKMINF